MTKTKSKSIMLDVTRMTRTMYFFIVFFALSIVVFDAGNLITRDAVIQRWSIATALLTLNTLAWFISAQKPKSISMRNAIITVITLTLVVAAGLMTYWERGMASTSTILFVLPLLVVAIARNRHALLATAVLSVGSYSFAAVKYFNDFFNEGLRIQLYGSVLLYGGIIFVCAWLIMILSDLRHDSI